MTPNHFHRDYETRSVVNLKKTGARVYMQHPTTSIWCCAHAMNAEPIKLWWPGQPVPADFFEADLDDACETWAHNNAFEAMVEDYIAGPRHGFPVFQPAKQRCTMAAAFAMALPGALENTAPALGLDLKKDMTGKRVMMQLAKPRKIDFAPGFDEIPFTAVRVAEMDAEGWEVYEVGGRACARVQWWNTPEKIERLGLYCMDDVAVERALVPRLRPLSKSELALWHLDQKINKRGIVIDKKLANAAMKIIAVAAARLDERMRELTDRAVSRCSNRNEIVKWVREQGVECDSIAKAAMEELLAEDNPLPQHVRDVLLVRQESAKASVAKIDTLLRGESPNGRASDLIQWHAASTGRWAGRRFQPQNLKRPEYEALVPFLVDVVAAGDVEFLDMVGIEPLAAVGDILRGLIVAAPGHRIVAADYSNIEGRVLAWLAGEDWKLQAFRDFDAGTGHDLYKVAAGGILNKAPGDVTKGERQNTGKVSELAFGFQGGYGAWMKFARGEAAEYPRAKIDGIKDAWREKHPAIKAFWYAMEDAAVEAVRSRGSTTAAGPIRFKQAGSFLFMRLPSGRFLCYPYPEVREFDLPWNKPDPEWVPCDSVGEARFLYGDVPFDEVKKRALVYLPARKDGLTYFSTIDVSKKAKIVPDDKNSGLWARIKTYGGMLAENATQAVARDVLADAMPRLEAAGYPVVLTVHDEVVCEVPDGHGSVEEMEQIMCDLPEWAAGLPVAAEGFEGERYRK